MGVLRYRKNDPQQFIAALIYATIVQSTGECLVLLATPTITAAGVLRSILESFADLCAIAMDPQYGQRMLATFAYRKQKHFENMIAEPANAFHSSLAPHIDPPTRLIEVKAELKKLKDAGYERLEPWQRFKAAGLVELYQGLYWQLSLKSHNTIAALEMRHVVNQGSDYSLTPCQANGVMELVTYFDPLVTILLDSSLKIHNLLSSDKASKYVETMDQYRAFRSTLGTGP